MAWVLGMLAAVGVALGGPETQLSFDKNKAGNRYQFQMSWKDAAKKKQEISFALPANKIDADREETTWLPRRELNEHVAKAVRAYGKTVKKVKITATIKNGAVHTSASGTGDVRGAIKKAGVIQQQAADAWLADNAFTRLKGGDVSFDHAKLAGQYAADLAPVAAALREGTSSDRQFVSRALSFVQSIPYEARKRKGGDPGYRRPLALLARNRGDCDSKTVLFLAIVHAELARVPLAVVYVPGHALAGVGLPKQSGDKSFRLGDAELLYAEPVGPAQHPLGAKVPGKHKVGRGEARLVR